MTDLQIRYFLTTARCLNFTEAAKQLFISQPALSQQITALEKELNMQLFIREKRKVFLTPAAAVLLQELPKYNRYYEEIIENAKLANEGRSGALTIAVMESEAIDPEVLKQCFDFMSAYPGISLRPTTASFGALKDMLMMGEVDLIYTVDYEIEDNPLLLSRKVAIDHGVAIVSKYHPLAKKNIHELSELSSETFILLSSEESHKSRNFFIEDCKRAGFTPRVKYASGIAEANILAELGQGITVTNHQDLSCYNPNIVTLDQLHIADRHFVFAWRKDNINASIPLFISSFSEVQ